MVCRVAGLLADSLIMPVVGFQTLPGASVNPDPGPSSRPVAAQPILLATPDPGLPTETAVKATWGGYLADYNQSDLNGGSRGFAAASLTVNQTLPAPRPRSLRPGISRPSRWGP
jgi:hypothetical protein